MFNLYWFIHMLRDVVTEMMDSNIPAAIKTFGPDTWITAPTTCGECGDLHDPAARYDELCYAQDQSPTYLQTRR